MRLFVRLDYNYVTAVKPRTPGLSGEVNGIVHQEYTDYIIFSQKLQYLSLCNIFPVQLIVEIA